MSIRYIAATDYLLDHIVGGASELPTVQLSELAVSAVSFETILASVEQETSLRPADRAKWRTNMTNFRKLLLQSGGEVPALSLSTLERWGKVLLLDLTHESEEGPEEMSVEERLVIATAADLGLIYLTPARDWNDTLRDELGLAIEES